jgi:hypothetical protein
MGGFFIVILIIVAVVVISTLNKDLKQAWEAAARQLSLTLHFPGWPSLPKLQGIVDGCTVSVSAVVRGAGKHRRRYTVFEVLYPRPLDFKLRMTCEGFWSTVTRTFGIQDIKTGYPDFDDAYNIRGEPPEAVREFLTHERRHAVADILQAYPAATIGSAHLVWEMRGSVRDGQVIVGKLNHLVRLTKAFLAGHEREAETAPAARPRHGFAPDVPPTAVPRKPTPEQQSPVPATPSPEPAPAPSPPPPLEPVEGPPPPPPQPPIVPVAPDCDVAQLCATLFNPRQSSFEARRIFDERYKGTTVSLEGVLRSVESYSYDLTFGSQPGTKGVFEIGEAPASMSGEAKILAAVAFSPDEKGRLESSRGARLRFAGTLHTVDGFMRTVFFTGGRIEGKET